MFQDITVSRDLNDQFKRFVQTKHREDGKGSVRIWDKVFKKELSKFCGRQPLKNIFLQIFEDCLLQNLPSPLLNTLSHFMLWAKYFVRKYHPS